MCMVDTGKKRNAICTVCREAKYGRILAKYADDPKTLFIISTDFCHWGTRFNYTFTDKSKVRTPACHVLPQARSVGRPVLCMLVVPAKACQRWDYPASALVRCCLTCRAPSIRPLNGLIMRAWTSLSRQAFQAELLLLWLSSCAYLWPPHAHGALHNRSDVLGVQGEPTAFTEYLRRYGNTICGRHPIGVFLQVRRVRE